MGLTFSFDFSFTSCTFCPIAALSNASPGATLLLSSAPCGFAPVAIPCCEFVAIVEETKGADGGQA